MIAFGPIPSRRLGQSLGINHIPPKACSYNCSYCQAGLTTQKTAERQAFYDPAEVVAAVRERVRALRAAGEPIDYLSFVPDGEPTLDVHLGEEIDALRPLGIPIAVITNGSLLWRPEVRAEVARADWVSVKVDTVDERAWMRLDRPTPQLHLPTVLQGIRDFAREYRGEWVSETMLVAGVNDDEAGVRRVVEFLTEVQPSRAYLLVPTRPPAEAAVQPPSDAAIARACALFRARLPVVECLVGHETSRFAATGELEADLLATLAVHPMRESAVRDLVRREGADWSAVERLLAAGRLVPTQYRGERFFTLGSG